MVGRDDARRLWEMGEEAKRLLAERVERHAIACDLKWGYLFAAVKRRHMDDLAALDAEWRAVGYDRAELVGPDRLDRYVRSLRYRGGLHDPGSGQLHPLNYALGLARAAAGAGVRLHEGTPVDRLEAGEPAVLTTPGGTVRARYVALAGNAYLPGLSAEVGRRVRPRIMPVNTLGRRDRAAGRGAGAGPDPGRRGRSPTSTSCSTIFRLTPDTRLLFGGIVSYSLFQRGDAGPATRRRLGRVFPSLSRVGIDHCWGGLVGITVNRLPDLGRVAPNVLLCPGVLGPRRGADRPSPGGRWPRRSPAPRSASTSLPASRTPTSPAAACSACRPWCWARPGTGCGICWRDGGGGLNPSRVTRFFSVMSTH